MVCPNCHSDQIITVQDQQFCISCGLVVPPPAAKKTKAGASVAVQENGLPEGVKILPVGGAASPTASAAAPQAPAPEPVLAPEKTPATKIIKSSGAEVHPIIKSRSRIGAPTEPETGAGTPPDNPATPATGTDSPAAIAGPRKRGPGRPKAGRLDVPRPVASTAPATLPDAPKLAPSATPASEAPAVPAARAAVITPTAPSASTIAPSHVGPRRMSDIAPPRPSRRASSHAAAKPAGDPQPEPASEPQAKSKKTAKAVPKGFKLFAHNHHDRPAKHHVHKVGVAPLHYGSVLAFSLRARFHPRLLGLASLASLSLAAAIGYGTWLALNGGLPNLAKQFLGGGPQVIGEALILTVLYYIGRSVGQSAITYGIAREADQRPVSLARQLGIGINTFTRRLRLDLGFGTAECLLVGAVIALVLTGGSHWPVDTQFQVAALFIGFLLLLYLLTALALARGLAGINLTLSTARPWTAAKLGWKLFSHRFELLALRFFALSLELILAVPLIALAVALTVAAPAALHFAVVATVTILALLAGSLLGAGTAAWWAALYRKLVLLDQKDQAVQLLSSRQPEDARPGPLALIVSLSTFLFVVALALPWLNL